MVDMNGRIVKNNRIGLLLVIIKLVSGCNPSFISVANGL